MSKDLCLKQVRLYGGTERSRNRLFDQKYVQGHQIHFFALKILDNDERPAFLLAEIGL